MLQESVFHSLLTVIGERNEIGYRLSPSNREVREYAWTRPQWSAILLTPMTNRLPDHRYFIAAWKKLALTIGVMFGTVVSGFATSYITFGVAGTIPTAINGLGVVTG